MMHMQRTKAVLAALLLLAAVALPLAAAAASAAAAAQPPVKIKVDGQAVVDQLLHLATFSDDANPAVTRILFTGGCWGCWPGGLLEGVQAGAELAPPPFPPAPTSLTLPLPST